MAPVLFHIGSVLIPSYGVLAAVGVLLALGLAQRTARMAGLDAGKVWNLCVVALFAALAGERVLLIALNWSVIERHPSWWMSLAMIHHPLLESAGALVGLLAAVMVARRQQMPLRATADALAAPLSLGLALEQVGALLAGSGYGTETTVRWAVTYTNPLAAQWSGTPLGVAVHPVQAYAAVAYLTLAVLLLAGQTMLRRAGDAAGLWLLATGAIVFFTEVWRDWAGRGHLLGGALDGPQAAAVVLVLAGALVLWEWKSRMAATAGGDAGRA